MILLNIQCLKNKGQVFYKMITSKLYYQCYHLLKIYIVNQKAVCDNIDINICKILMFLSFMGKILIQNYSKINIGNTCFYFNVNSWI